MTYSQAMKQPSNFDDYSAYYDLFYRDKDYLAEVDYIDQLLQLNDCKGSEILEFGSGTGKHGALLGERGYQIRGIERSPEMISRSQKTTKFVCEQGDICNLRLGRTFDAVLSLFHVMSYQVSNDSVRDVFTSASEHLLPGGLFIFDVWYTPAVLSQRPSIRVKRLESDSIRAMRIAEPKIYPNQNRVDVNYSIISENLQTGAFHTFSECHPMRHFSLPELDFLAKFSGFERLSAKEFLSGEQPSESTWAICLILRKL